jgi:hypothetical protein
LGLANASAGDSASAKAKYNFSFISNLSAALIGRAERITGFIFHAAKPELSGETNGNNML